MRLSKLSLLFAAVFMLPASTLLANPSPQVPNISGAVADDEKPAELFKNGIVQLQAFMASGQLQNPAAVRTFVQQKIRPYFDFERMARLVGGSFYGRLNKDEKAVFRGRLEGMFLSAFAQEIALTSGQGPAPRIDFMKKRHSTDGNEMEVMGRVLYSNGSAKRLVLSFNKSPEGWKIFDVSANGSSAVLYYRQYFMSMARKYGPDALLN